MGKMNNITLHERDIRYLDEHYQEYDEFIDWEDLSPEWVQYIEAKQGIVNHRTRNMVKSSAYDWQKIREWMERNRMSNSNFAALLNCSSGTIANIRNGYYTRSELVDRILAMIEEYN